MKVYGFTKEGEGIREIPNTYEARKSFVGGHTETVFLTNELILICNEEGKMLGLKEMCVWLEDKEILDIICGNCFICRFNEEDYLDIKESDIEIIKNKLKPVTIRFGNYVIYNNR